MLRAALACLLFSLPVCGFATPVEDNSPDTATSSGPLADSTPWGSLDRDDGFGAAARKLVIAYRPAFADSDLSWKSLHSEEEAQPPAPGAVDDRLTYLSSTLLMIAAGLTVLWYLSRYGRGRSKRRSHRSSRTHRSRESADRDGTRLAR